MLLEQYIISHAYGIVHPLAGGFDRVYSYICFGILEVRIKVYFIVRIRSDEEYYFVRVLYGYFSVCV